MKIWNDACIEINLLYGVIGRYTPFDDGAQGPVTMSRKLVVVWVVIWVFNATFISVASWHSFFFFFLVEEAGVHVENCWPTNFVTELYRVLTMKGPSWSWSYGSWIYNYLFNQNQRLSPPTLCVQIPFMARFTGYDKMYQQNEQSPLTSNHWT